MLLHHEVTGDGPPVLLIHAGVADSRMWVAQVPALVAAGHKVITLDLRGFGRSVPPPGAFLHVEDVIGVLDHLGVDRPDVVAASFGGLVALGVASAYPERVARLVLLAPPVPDVDAGAPLEQFWEREEAMLDAGDVDGAARLNAESWLGREASDEARALVHEMQRTAFELQLVQPDSESEDPDPDLAAVTAQTLVCTGDHDFDFFRRGGDRLEAALPNVRRVNFAWAGHLPALERPQEIADLLVDTLRSSA